MRESFSGKAESSLSAIDLDSIRERLTPVKKVNYDLQYAQRWSDIGLKNSKGR